MAQSSYESITLQKFATSRAAGQHVQDGWYRGTGTVPVPNFRGTGTLVPAGGTGVPVGGTG
eukprot:gene6021-16015_t